MALGGNGMEDKEMSVLPSPSSSRTKRSSSEEPRDKIMGVSSRIRKELTNKANEAKSKRGKSVLKIHREKTLRVEFQKYQPNPSNLMVDDASPTYTISEHIFFTLTHPHFSLLSYVVYIIIFLAIIVSTLMFILESEPSLLEFPEGCDFMTNVSRVREMMVQDNPLVMACKPKPPSYFHVMETITISIFTIEYVLRLLTVGFCRNWSPESLTPDDDTPNFKFQMLHFLSDEFNIVDVTSIVPYFLNLALVGAMKDFEGFALTKVLRLARLFRVFKLGKHSEMAVLMFKVMAKSRQALQMLAFISLLAMVLFGSLIYYAEQGMWVGPSAEYPNGVYMRDVGFGKMAPTPFKSVVDSFWWAIVTTTTVGYGEYVPTTVEGKVIATIAMMAGILLIALPITIIGTNFNTEFIVRNMKKDEARHLEMSSSSSSSSCDDSEFTRTRNDGSMKLEDLDDLPRFNEHIVTPVSETARSSTKTQNSKQELRQEYQQLTFDEVVYTLETLKMEAEEKDWQLFDMIISEVQKACGPEASPNYDQLHTALTVITPLLTSIAIQDAANESELYHLFGDILALFSTVCVIETKKEIKKEKDNKKAAKMLASKKGGLSSSPSLKNKMASKLQGISRVAAFSSR